MKKAFFILLVLLPIGLIVWNFVFHPAAPVFLTALIIWLTGVFWLVIMFVEDLRQRIKRQEKKTKELKAVVEQKTKELGAVVEQKISGPAPSKELGAVVEQKINGPAPSTEQLHNQESAGPKRRYRDTVGATKY